MPRHKKIPKRLPPVTKDIMKAMTALSNYLGQIAKFEKDSIALENARLAMFPEPEKTKPTEQAKPTEPTTSTETPSPIKKNKRKKKHLNLNLEPGEINDSQNPNQPIS